MVRLFFSFTAIYIRYVIKYLNSVTFFSVTFYAMEYIRNLIMSKINIPYLKSKQKLTFQS